MKRFLSLALSAALLCALGAPALGAGGADARLSAVTEKVKAALELDTSAYDQFSGDLAENGVVPVWNLRWSGEKEELFIAATEEGRVLNYNLMENEPVLQNDSFGPSFPKLTRAEAADAARAFLDKALIPGVETAALDVGGGAGSLSAADYTFSGGILEHGLPSPFRFTITVRVSDRRVTGFYTMGNPTRFTGGLPSPVPAADGEKAAADLKETLKLRLEYVTGEGGGEAVLRYLPEAVHEYYVDAQTGKLVDLTALRQELADDRDNGEAYARPEAGLTAGGAMKDALTEAEQAGVAQLEGVLDQAALDAAARKITALGLSAYELAAANYSVDRDTGAVSARLQYARKSGGDIWRRYVTLDGKSGALLAVSSSMPWSEKDGTGLSASSAQARAEAFLKEQAGAQFAKTALYREAEKADPRQTSFTFARKENGYFYPADFLAVSIDADGAVSAYSKAFDEEISFQSPEGIVDLDAALDAWFRTYAVTLGYQAVPKKLDLSAPEWKPLVEQGVSCLNEQKLTYSMAREDWYLGVDAHTGEAVRGESAPEGEITYSDLDRHWVKAAAEALAAYGVGWTGGTMNPGRTLTQLDMLALLVSTQGYRYIYDSGNENAADELYRRAYQMGLLEKSERDDGAPVTRAQLVRTLLNSAGYDNIAGLEGIFTVAFSDRAEIEAAGCLGYAAVAQALGVVKGDKSGSFAPNRAATRAEAVNMLYNFMSR